MTQYLAVNCKIITTLLLLLFSSFVQASELHNAVFSNNLDRIENAIKKGDDVNEVNESGQWPLLIAATYELPKAAELLIKHGAKINFANQHGFTAIHEAASLNNIEVLEVLIKYNADINVKDINKHTPLHYALTSDAPNAARILQKMNAEQ